MFHEYSGITLSLFFFLNYFLQLVLDTWHWLLQFVKFSFNAMRVIEILRGSIIDYYRDYKMTFYELNKNFVIC